MQTVFDVLARAQPREILHALARREHSVGELERPQPTISKHLHILRNAGLFEARVDAQRRDGGGVAIRKLEDRVGTRWTSPFRR